MYNIFKATMVNDFGARLTVDEAVICIECGEPIYEEDFPNHNWDTCPVCGFNPTDYDELCDEDEDGDWEDDEELDEGEW